MKCVINADSSSGYSGGLVGFINYIDKQNFRIKKHLYGYNIIENATTFSGMYKGCVCGGTGNVDKDVIKIAGFSRQGSTIDVAPVVGKAADPDAPYGTGGYVVFADYNGAALNPTDNGEQFSAINSTNNVTRLTGVTDNTPYVTSNPTRQISDQYLTGDGCYSELSYNKSAIKSIIDDRTAGTNNKRYQYATYSSITGYETVEAFGTLLSAKYTDVQTALDAYGKNLTRNFPVLVVDSTDKVYSTNLINNYLRLLTNTQYDFADSSNDAVYGVVIQRMVWESAAWTPHADNVNLKRDAKTGGKGRFYINAGSYDNTATQFTLIDVQFYDPSDTNSSRKVAYHLYVPVIVKKMLRYGFESSLKSGTTYNLDYYTPKGNFLPENFGNTVTLEFAYTYQQTLSEWTTAIKGGESMLFAYNKKLRFQNSANQPDLPPGAKLVLVDPNDQNKMYYAEWTMSETNDTGLYSNRAGEGTEYWYMDLTQFTSGQDSTKKFSFPYMYEMFDIIMRQATDEDTENLFEEVTVSGETDEEKMASAISQEACIYTGGKFYKRVDEKETGHSYSVITNVEYKEGLPVVNIARLSEESDVTKYRMVAAKSDTTVEAYYQNTVKYFEHASDEDPEGTVYYSFEQYIKESYYLSIFTDQSSSDKVYNYEINGDSSFGNSAHPSQIEDKPNYSSLALGDLYENSFTITPGSESAKISLESNNKVTATLESTIGLTENARRIYFSTLLINNPSAEIYQSFLLYLNRQDEKVNGVYPAQLNGVLTESEPQIKVNSYMVGTTDVTTASNLKANHPVTPNYIEFRNNVNLRDKISNGVTITANVELTYNSDLLIGQAFPFRKDRDGNPDTNVGTRILGYSNIASDKLSTANSSASVIPTPLPTKKYYCSVSNTSELIFEAQAKDSTGLYGRLGINALNLSGDDADGTVELAAIARYDISKLRSRSDYAKVRLTYELYTKQLNSNTYFTTQSVPNDEGGTTTQYVYTPLKLQTYLSAFALYDREKTTNNTPIPHTMTATPDGNTTAYEYLLTKAQLANQYDSDTFTFTFPIDFEIYTGDNNHFEDAQTPLMYSNYKLMLKVELLDAENAVIDTQNDWIVYTNARVYADVIDAVKDKKTNE